MINNKQRNYFSASNLFPLWVGCFDRFNRPKIARQVLGYINRLQLDKFPGGVPNTLANTGQQWDYPNVWPPMQYILIEGLRNLGSKSASDLAYKWSLRWIQSNYLAYNETQVMFEKVSQGLYYF